MNFAYSSLRASNCLYFISDCFPETKMINVTNTEKSVICSIDRFEIKPIMVEKKIGSENTSSFEGSSAGEFSAKDSNSAGSLEGAGEASGIADTAGLVEASVSATASLSA